MHEKAATSFFKCYFDSRVAAVDGGERVCVMSETVNRVLPSLDGPAGFFWTSGADGTLRFLCCTACTYFIHPPTSYCPRCGGREAIPARVSGRGSVYSFTVNHQPWDGGLDPYVIGIVDMVEQAGLRLMTNIVGTAPEDVYIGMQVEVVFEDHDPAFLPMFRPVTS
jgi:uncharacterized protein